MRSSRQWRKWVAVGLGTALLGVAAGLGIAAGQGDPSTGPQISAVPTTGAPAIGALAAPQDAQAAHLTTLYTGNAFAEAVGLQPQGIRSALREGGDAVFVAPTNLGWVCVFLVGEAGQGVPGASCAPQADLSSRPLFIETVRRDGTSDIAGIVPDGYTHATFAGTSAAVKGNAFLLKGASGSGRLEVRGSNVPALSVEAGAP